MPDQIRDIMTKKIHTVTSNTALSEVARLMRDQRIGNVLVTSPDGSLCGIVTDRDIVVRADAAAKPLQTTKVGEICSDPVVKLEPNASVDDAVTVMRQHAIRRVAVVSDGHPVGIVSIGDLARHKDPNSALAQISSAEPNN